MIGYPYGEAPGQRTVYDGFGNSLGRCRLIALRPFRLRPRVLPVVPRMRLRFNFGETELGAAPPPMVAPRAQQQMLYDGLGNPLGLFPVLAALAPLAAKAAAVALPLAAKALPFLTKAIPSLVTQAASALPGLIPLPGAIPGAPAPPTVHSPTVQMVAPGATVAPPPSCPPPTMEECRRLYPIPVMPFPAAPIRRRRPRIVRGRSR